MIIKKISKEDLVNGFTFPFNFKSHFYFDVSFLNNGEETSFNLTPKISQKENVFDIHEIIFDEYKGDIDCYGVYDQDKLIAILTYRYESWNNSVILHDLYVLEEYRMKGIGRQLFHLTLEEALKCGARIITLETMSMNGTAILFYKSLGFQIIGVNIAKYTNDDLLFKNVYIEMGYLLKEVRH